jgi:hypothetical protein
VYFWRDRTREVDFLVEAGGRVELFEAKWGEIPDVRDAVNLAFVRNILGSGMVSNAAVVCRAAHGWPLAPGLHAAPVSEL